MADKVDRGDSLVDQKSGVSQNSSPKRRFRSESADEEGTNECRQRPIVRRYSYHGAPQLSSNIPSSPQHLQVHKVSPRCHSGESSSSPPSKAEPIVDDIFTDSTDEQVHFIDRICVFGFANKQRSGYELEYMHPPPADDNPSPLDDFCRLAQQLAIPDGSHKNQCVRLMFFVPNNLTPSLNHSTSFCLSIYVQRSSAAAPRHSFQRSVVLVLQRPIFGLYERIFTDRVQSWMDSFASSDFVIDSFDGIDSIWRELRAIPTNNAHNSLLYVANYGFESYSLLNFLQEYGATIVISLIKALLLEVNIVVIHPDAAKVSVFMNYILSLFPKLMEDGLVECAKIINEPVSSVPDDVDSPYLDMIRCGVSSFSENIFPFPLFPRGHLCLPMYHITLSRATHVRESADLAARISYDLKQYNRYFIGASSQSILMAPTRLFPSCQLLVDLSTKTIIKSNTSIGELIKATSADSRFVADLCDKSSQLELNSDRNLFIQSKFAQYFKGLASSACGKALSLKFPTLYGDQFVSAWLKTDNYLLWSRVPRLTLNETSYIHPTPESTSILANIGSQLYNGDAGESIQKDIADLANRSKATLSKGFGLLKRIYDD